MTDDPSSNLFSLSATIGNCTYLLGMYTSAEVKAFRNEFTGKNTTTSVRELRRFSEFIVV